MVFPSCRESILIIENSTEVLQSVNKFESDKSERETIWLVGFHSPGNNPALIIPSL